MKVRLETSVIGQGDKLFHVSVQSRYNDAPESMYLVAANNMATALYTAWTQYYDDEEPLDLDKCDGYLIGTIEVSL